MLVCVLNMGDSTGKKIDMNVIKNKKSGDDTHIAATESNNRSVPAA